MITPIGQTGAVTSGGTGAAGSAAARRCIAFFGYDSAESTLIKRVKSFQACGSRVIGFMFRRDRGTEVAAPVTWENVDLGVTVDRNYARRIPKLIHAIAIVVRHKSLLGQCQIWYARNIDMLLVAAAAKLLTRRDAVLVYEVLDVQRIFLGQGAVNAAARWVERLLMRSCDLLVVSSPDFVERYYAPQQRLSIPWRLLENKIAAGSLPNDAREGGKGALSAAPPWVIGWYGTLRCARSLDILCKIADALGEKVRIVLRGRGSDEDLPSETIAATIARHPNMTFGGPYANPNDLADLYGRVHFSWAVDYLDAGTNSDWLLPNRIYEGGYFGAMALARAGTATGRAVEARGLGWSFEEPLEKSVSAFLDQLDVETYVRARGTVEALDRSAFVDETDTRDLLEHIDTLCRRVLPRQAFEMGSASERTSA